MTRLTKAQKRELTFTERHTMYNLLPLMARTAIICIIPKCIDAAHDALFKTKKFHVKRTKFIKRNFTKQAGERKPYDMTKLTQEDYDIIVKRHAEFKEINIKRRLNNKIPHQLPYLVKALNKELKVTKSPAVYSRIYLGHVKREDYLSRGTNKKSPVKLVKTMSDIDKLVP